MVNIHLNREVEKLKQLLLNQSLLVEKALDKTLKSFLECDLDLTNQIIVEDRKIDFREIEIEEECLKVLALHQPVAGDLRYVMTCLKVNNDLERVGDLCCNIACQCQEIIKHQSARNGCSKNLELMFSEAVQILNNSLESLVSADKELAIQTLKNDDIIDNLYSKINKKVIEKIECKPEEVRYYLALETIARHLERIGDYATNICEDVIYMINGEICRHKNCHEK
ncbi:phosphate signaling complex protein PhoU [Lentisphaerota bacterium WC36G]|nr:phosphate signaling complex protein PhoU [Lentisphaerae bacterium WC36]